MAILKALDGDLRLYDGTLGRFLSTENIDVHIKSAGAISYFAPFQPILTLNTHILFVGQAFPFTKVYFIIRHGAKGGGSLIVEYWNRGWYEVSDLNDGTETLTKTGVVSWRLSSDWEKNRLYYVRIRMTKTPELAAVPTLIEPCSGQFLDLPFNAIEVEGPQGRTRPEEAMFNHRIGEEPTMLEIEREKEPLDLKIRCVLEEPVVPMVLMQALAVGNPEINTWPFEGKTTKTLSHIPDSNGNLQKTNKFEDPRKTLDVQIKCGDTIWEWREVYFEIESAENYEDCGIQLTGACYGAIYSNRIQSLGMEIAA